MKNLLEQRFGQFIGLAALIAVCALGAATAHRWVPMLQQRILAASRQSGATATSLEPAEHAGHVHSGGHSHHGVGVHDSAENNHAHGHAGHGHAAHAGHNHGDGHGHAGVSHSDHETNALKLSAEALRNVGLIDEQIRRVELSTFWRAITVPAQVVGRAGRTQLQVATPMTGMITHVHATQGEAVAPGTLLFRIRLTHEDLLQLQTEFLQTIGELDVEEREIERLVDATRSQAIPGQLLLEREYERDKLTALRNAQREALRLHGLHDEQIQAIFTDHRLIRELDVFAPSVDRHPPDERRPQSVGYVRDNPEANPHATNAENLLVMERLNVHKGQVVSAGATLCVLKDYSQLFIEGLAFERDIPTLRRALQEHRDVAAVFERSEEGIDVVRGLQIEHLANEVDSDSRSVRFFVRLPNQITNEHRRGDAQFVEWAWMIGQRAQLRVPYGHWKNQIVLPSDAVAVEGTENYVFRSHGEHFDRVAIRIKHRDPLYVVVERDGAISPGNQLAWQGAHQMQMALRRQSSGPVDAHHGHTH